MLGPSKPLRRAVPVEEPSQTVKLVKFSLVLRLSDNLCINILQKNIFCNLQFQDDEYRWAGVEDPKIMITTSRDPSSKLKQFAKELRLIFPGAQRLNRGTYEFKQLMEACR